MKSLSRLIVLLTLCSAVSGQSGQIVGRVIDARTKEPLVGANVLVTSPVLAFPTGAATGTDGHYVIIDLSAGTYAVKVSYVGYSQQQISVELTEGETITRNFSLEPEAIQFQTYVVTASRRRERIEDAPAAITVITERAIRRESNTNLGDYLKAIKGVDFTQSGVDSYNLSARGFNSSFSSRLLTLTDGRMANVPSLRLIAYNVIPVSFDDVKQFEVVLGPSSALYGPNAHSGVLNIITKSPKESLGTNVSIQAGERDIKKLSIRHSSTWGPIGIKASGVAFTATDWEHFNDDEYEGHQVALLGRWHLLRDRVNNDNSATEFGNPKFTGEMLTEFVEGEIPFNGVDDNGNGWIDETTAWDGLAFADGFDNPTPWGGSDAEAGSPTITADMIEGEIPGNGLDDNGNGLIDETGGDIGQGYADGVDNDHDGFIDEGIDTGIDDSGEKWYDGVDNDGDGKVDELDETGSRWLDRFGSYKKDGFGDYEINSEGELVFDTNNNGIFGDNLGFDGIDNDGDGLIDEFGEGDVVLKHPEGFSQWTHDANNDGILDFPDFKVKNYRYDIRVDYDPNPNFSLNLAHGYAWARNINITGIARYLADGWVYRYYQARMHYKNFFLQSYLNTSYSGDPSHPTRNLATGGTIFDRSKKFSLQLQHSMEFFADKLRFVWGTDYFITMPDTRGTILSDNNAYDGRDSDGDGEAGSPIAWTDFNDNTRYDDGEPYVRWGTDSGKQDGIPDSLDNATGAIADGIDNDGDSDDFKDLDGDGQPDPGEPGVDQLGYVIADGIDNDGDGRVDENIDEGIDEKDEDNRKIVNELGLYYQLNWKISKKWEFVHATRFDVHDRLTDMVQFNNQDRNNNPFKWEFDFSNREGLQVSPKFGLIYRPRENQNFRLTWAQAFNTPSNQALFLDIFVTRFAIFKVYARGADGGYSFPVASDSSIYYYDINTFDYEKMDTSKYIFFYPSTDPRVSGYYKDKVKNNLPEIEAEIVKTWELGYKGRLAPTLFGTVDLFTSHYNSFVSPVTFITPIIIDKTVLTTDWNNDGTSNSVGNITDQEDLDESYDHVRDNIVGVSALDTSAGTPPVVVGYINYGEVDLSGIDMSLTWFINRNLTLDLVYSFLSISEFLNPITGVKDPINAPRNKWGVEFAFDHLLGLSGVIHYRHVDSFSWSSGIYFGRIKAYDIFDLHLGYKINDHLTFRLTAANIFDRRHTEIIGGPKLGRQTVMRLEATL